MGRAFALAVLSALVAGCTQPEPALTDPERAAIADSVTSGMDGYAAAIKALDVQRVLGYYGDPAQFRFIDNGTVYSHAELKPMVQGLFGSLRSYEGGFGTIHVSVLNRDAAVADAPYIDVFTDTTGAVTRIRGVVTWVWVRTAEGWRIVHGQGFGVPDTTATP